MRSFATSAALEDLEVLTALDTADLHTLRNSPTRHLPSLSLFHTQGNQDTKSKLFLIQHSRVSNW